MHERENPERPDDATESADDVPSPDEPTLSEYDKELADSFPASDPPSQP